VSIVTGAIQDCCEEIETWAGRWQVEHDVTEPQVQANQAHLPLGVHVQSGGDLCF
jgi:hypothetical protein